MKIAKIEHMQANAGFRRACFLKITTNEGIIGWSEYNEHTGTAEVTGVIAALGALIVGMDPFQIERIAAFLHGHTFQARGGVNQHAIAALTNALLDIKGKALNVPVHGLFGGAFRDRLPLYWSHCGTYRVRYSDMLKLPPLRNFDDVVRLGEEVRRRGFKALKTGLLDFDGQTFSNFSPGFGHTPGWPELNVDRRVLNTLERQLQAFADGAGPDVSLMLDVNCHFKTEGFLEVARAVRRFHLLWLELDTSNSSALERVRSAAECPIASCETLYGRCELLPFLDGYAVDVAIIDVTWNGYLEAIKMAELAATYNVNVAPHNYCAGLLGDVISAHFSAAVPNLRIVEYDVDDVPWKAEFLTHPPVIEDGEMIVPQRPGWGSDVNEDAVRAHPV